MGLSYQENYQVPFYESDINHNMKLPQLLSLVLQVSGKQSLSLGMSDDYIYQTYNLVWIITEYAIEIERLPKYTENIVIETVPTAYNKLFCYRDFNVYGESGDKIMTIHSTFVSWIMIAERFTLLLMKLLTFMTLKRLKNRSWSSLRKLGNSRRNNLSRSLF